MRSKRERRAAKRRKPRTASVFVPELGRSVRVRRLSLDEFRAISASIPVGVDISARIHERAVIARAAISPMPARELLGLSTAACDRLSNVILNLNPQMTKMLRSSSLTTEQVQAAIDEREAA